MWRLFEAGALTRAVLIHIYICKYGMLSMGDSSGVEGLRNELLAPSVLILEEVQIQISLLSRKTCD